MKILICGDVVGRTGRQAVLTHVPALRRELKLDMVIVDADNAAGGFGVTGDIAREFFANGVDVLCGGDHVWDQRDMYQYIASEPRMLRPLNFPATVPGKGTYLHSTASGKKVLVVHALGQVFHKENLNCPFAGIDEALKRYTLGATVNAIIVDFHAEATSEKMAMGRYLDGRVSSVTGAHTHVPTADARVLSGGTAYQTDLGMCGDYDTVIGFKEEAPLNAFLQKMRRIRMEPGEGEATLCGALIETDDKTGLSKSITTIRRGGLLGDA